MRFAFAAYQRNQLAATKTMPGHARNRAGFHQRLRFVLIAIFAFFPSYGKTPGGHVLIVHQCRTFSMSASAFDFICKSSVNDLGKTVIRSDFDREGGPRSEMYQAGGDVRP